MNHKHTHYILLSVGLISLLVTMGTYVYMHRIIKTEVDMAISAREHSILGASKQNREQEISKIYDNTAINRAKIRNIFISSSVVVDFIEALESLGAQAGSKISLSSISSDTAVGAPIGTFGVVSAKVEVKGTWLSVVKILMLGEVLPYKVSIDHVRFDNISSSANKPEWRLIFRIQATTVVTEIKK